MDLLTIGDFYRKRYGQAGGGVTSVAITVSYLGWTSAQLTALGLVVLGPLRRRDLACNRHPDRRA